MPLKRYVILYNDTQMVYGIKADLNPHNLKPAFCAGNPNALGGAIKKFNETVITSLKREVSEETAGAFELIGPGQLFFRKPGYEFYHSNQFRQVSHNWPSEVDRLATLEDDSLEFCWIAVAPKTAFRAAMTKEDVGRALLAIAKAQALLRPDSSQIKLALTNEYLGSHTSQAFLEFVQNWQAGSLPPGGPVIEKMQ